MSIVTGTPGPAGHPETRITFSDGSSDTYEWSGEIDKQTMVDAGLFDENEWTWIKEPVTVDIGNTVTSLGYSFSSCSSLTSVTISDSVTSIGNNAFRDCGGLTSITIGDGVTSIGESAFEGCTSITSVTIPDSVTSIRSYAFEGCSGLTSITIGDGVTSIDDTAFAYCSGLTSVTIPASVTSIGTGVFSVCRGLTSVTFNSFTKDEVKSLTTSDYIFGGAFYDDEYNPMEKSFTAICTDGSMTIHFSEDNPATITFTDL